MQTRTIKSGNGNGVARTVQGLTVSIEPHPKYKNLYRFIVDDEVWICSDYAFEEEGDKNE